MPSFRFLAAATGGGERLLGEQALDECHEVPSVLVLVGGLLSVEHGSAPLLACAWTGWPAAARRSEVSTEVTPVVGSLRHGR
jgi:hypothetical protein